MAARADSESPRVTCPQHAIVEGSTGSVLASVYPEKAQSPYILVAILGLILFGIEGLIITDPFLKLAV
ncbi:MAG: hypothetical protein IH936_02685 [Acidobacteria bacterium]|nr:hypothetical protein [Acidobacteriota bacterium]